MKTKKILGQLKAIRTIATMERASFGNAGEDCLIKNKTKIWRETWIISPLDEIIKEMEGGKQ